MARAVAGASGALLEREVELELLRDAVTLLPEGRGASFLVEGAAGIGKTRLLAAAAELARDAGAVVLEARAGTLERELPFGVATQLFEPLLRGAEEHDRSELLKGAAHMAAPAVGLVDAHQQPVTAGSGDLMFAALHGLYWLCLNLAEHAPVVLCVDDLQWCDAPTLKWLAYLVRRLEGTPVLPVLAWRVGEPDADQAALAALREAPRVQRIAPAPLSSDAATDLVSAALPGASERFAEACHELTGGNPFLLEQLVRHVESDGLEITDAGADRLVGVSPQSIVSALAGRLGRLGPAATAFARALALLGRSAGFERVAALAGLDAATAAEANDALARAGLLLDGDRLDFAHPIVGAAIYEELVAPARSAHHAAAARLLFDQHADVEDVALPLLLTDPAGEPWRVDVLRRAGAASLARGVPAAAVAQLRRALAEGPADHRAELLHELGRAEQRAGDGETALPHLREALELAADEHRRVAVATDLFSALLVMRSAAEAVEMLEAEAARGQADRELALTLDALAIVARGYALMPPGRERAERIAGLAGDTPAERFALASLTGAARTAAELGDLTEQVLEGGRLLAELGSDSLAYARLISQLTLADREDAARDCLERALEDSRERGMLNGHGPMLGMRAVLEHRVGGLREAEVDARSALELARHARWTLGITWAAAPLLWSLADQGTLDEAEELAAATEVDDSAPEFGVLFFLFGRARVHAAALRWEDALADLRRIEAASRLVKGTGSRGGSRRPGLFALGTAIAEALRALGDDAAAREAATEELELARIWGAPRAVGIALRGVATTSRGDEQVELLRQSVAELERSPARLELARSLVEHGAALRRARERSAAREPLARGLELARRCGATPLAERAREELLATGARPRRMALSGVDSLTPSQLRVARLVAGGATNREVAQALFVTPRTVDAHLRAIFRKLDIASRSELPAALAS